MTFDRTNQGYVARFVDALDHPERLWQRAFETHLGPDHQLLAVALATLPPVVEVEDLEQAHRALCIKRRISHSAASYRSALQVMEGSFIAITKLGGKPAVRFHNPSIREFTLDWLAADQALLADVLECAWFFEQLSYLFGYSGTTQRIAARPGLRAALEAVRPAVGSAVVRLMISPSAERRDEWVPDRGSITQRPSSWFEDRLLTVLTLPPEVRPTNDWIREQVLLLAERWERREGEKAAAVGLLRELKKRVTDRSDEEQLPDAIAVAQSALDSWLAMALEDIEVDWLPYLDRLEHDQGATLELEFDLARRFEAFVREEFARWSPSPPHLEQLIEYSERFGLDDLTEDLEQALSGQRERDEEESERRITPDPTPRESSEPEGESLEMMFRRLAAGSAWRVNE